MSMKGDCSSKIYQWCLASIWRRFTPISCRPWYIPQRCNIKWDLDEILFPRFHVVNESLTLSIIEAKDIIEKSTFYKYNGIIYRFNGYFPNLEYLPQCMSFSYIPNIKEEYYIFPCTEGFFIVEI